MVMLMKLLGPDYAVWDKESTVFFKLAEGRTATAEELIAYCRKELAAYKVPRRIEFRDTLPKTLIGKLSKKELIAEEMAKASAAEAPGEQMREHLSEQKS